MRRIILTGGGTGGHITPLLAVAHALKQLDPDCYVIYIGERNGKYASLTKDSPNIDETRSIFAGKFRRYHGESWILRMFDVKTNLLNIRDLFYFLLGTLQSFVLVRMLKPDMILLKGGFVGVPVGLAAAFWRLPFVTHDSDALPGLANRIVGRWAKLHATALPAKYYRYKESQVRHIGVLVGESYQAVDEKQQRVFKQQLGIDTSAKVLLVTGGSGGAAAINESVRTIIDELLERQPQVQVIHQVGIGKAGVYEGYANNRLQVHELLRPMHAYTGAADVVVTRAGANTMAELGVQGKACVVIPNPLLTGGHQLKNAQILNEQHAAIVLDEKIIKKDPRQLLNAIDGLLQDESSRKALGVNLQAMTIPDATQRMAMILMDRGVPEDVRT